MSSIAVQRSYEQKRAKQTLGDIIPYSTINGTSGDSDNETSVDNAVAFVKKFR